MFIELINRILIDKNHSFYTFVLNELYLNSITQTYYMLCIIMPKIYIRQISFMFTLWSNNNLYKLFLLYPTNSICNSMTIRYEHRAVVTLQTNIVRQKKG